jgi:hypothetical protein
MADRLRSIDPLRHDVPIVDMSGRPTPQFMRQWMQTRSVDEAVGVASDSLAGLLDDFAAHGPRHHAGGDMALDLDSIAGALNGGKVYGSLGADTPLNEVISFDAVFGTLVVSTVEPATGLFTPQNGVGISCGNVDPANAVLAGIQPGAALCGNLNAEFLNGQPAAHYHDAANLTGSLADARLSSNVPLKATSSTYTASQIFQRTASNLLAIRFSTAAGAFTEIMVDGSYATGVGGSPRDLRHRRTAAGVLEIDNNAGGAAELDVTGYGLFGGSTVNAQAVLEARSTARGFLPPRMTTTQRDAISATPVAGLTVYNTTTSKVQTWDGAAWQDHW